MNIDRVARGMTAGGPTAGFTARVMAPISGRPRPGFTARVMNRIDEPAPRRSIAGRALVFAPAVLAVIVAVTILRGDAPVMPATPRAQGITAAPYARGPLGAPPLPVDRRAVDVTPRVRTPRALKVAPEVLPAAAPESLPFYTIAALEGPADIAVTPIGPAAPVIAPLGEPAPLKIHDIKEKS